jgi:BASS family bile acid:Na+ symporter
MRETLTQLFRITLAVVIPLASFATGVRAATVDPLWLFKHPSVLLRSLLAIFVLVPLAAVLFVDVIGAPPVIAGGVVIAILAVGIGPPAAFKRATAKQANLEYEVELNIVVQLLAILFVPLAIAVLGAIFHFAPRLEARAVARIVLERALIPLAIGIALARLAPRAATPLARIAGPVVQIALLAVVVVAVVATWKPLVAIGARAWLVAAAVALLSVTIGHLCGGGDRPQRRVLATFSAMRFPALALLIASILPRGRQMIPVVLAYVLCSFVFTAIYGAVSARHETSGAARPAGGLRGRLRHA